MTHEQRREVLANIAQRRTELTVQQEAATDELEEMDKIEAEYRAALAAVSLWPKAD